MNDLLLGNLISLYGWQNCLRIFATFHLACTLFSLTYRPLPNAKEDTFSSDKVHSSDSTYTESAFDMFTKNNNNVYYTAVNKLPG